MEFKDGVLWAGATSVWKSVDTGKTWTQTGGFWGIISEIKFYNDQIGVVVTTSDGIKLTRDQGRTWKQILYVGASSGCCFGDSPDEIYIISGDGILEVTENGGATWDAQSLRRTPFQLIKLGPGRIAMLSGTQDEMTSVRITTDKGKTWMPTLQQPIGVDYDSYSFAVDSCNKNLMYVANEESLLQTDGLSDIFHTTDGGATWGKVFSRPSDYLKGCVVVGPNTVYVTTAHDGLLRSTDKGDTWQTIGAPTSLVFDTRPIAVVNDDILFVADSVGTIWRTMNSGGTPITPTLTVVPIASKHLRNDTIGATVSVPIIMHAPELIATATMVLHYDTTMLIYKGTFDRYRNHVDDAQSNTPGRSVLTLHKIGEIIDDSVLAVAEFDVYPLKDSCTTVVIDSTVFPGREACLASAPATIEICSAVTCGSELISKFMRYGAVDLVALYPNPASHSVTLRPLTNAKILHVTFSDVLGRTLLVQEVTLDGVCTVPLESLPKGVIHVTVTAEGRAQSLQFIHQ